MPSKPTTKRAVAFIDGQNLFHSVREAFGYTYPNYDPVALATRICADRRWSLVQARFYTGIPDIRDNAHWNRFWIAKLGAMGHRGVHVFSRPLRYRNKWIKIGNQEHTIRVGEEKGIDVRIALDVVRMAYRNEYDVALVFSQDQDLSEVADDIRLIGRDQNRWIKMASAFPVSLARKDPRGVNKTDWIQIDKAMYDTCIDPRDYRAKGLPEDPKDK
jgi:uncharacterized LabA/DUF88 family protein